MGAPVIQSPAARRIVSLPPLPSEGGPTFIRKPCSSCGGMCSERDFGRDKRSSDGLRSQCLYCEGIADRQRYLRRKAAANKGMG